MIEAEAGTRPDVATTPRATRSTAEPSVDAIGAVTLMRATCAEARQDSGVARAEAAGRPRRHAA